MASEPGSRPEEGEGEGWRLADLPACLVKHLVCFGGAHTCTRWPPWDLSLREINYT